MSFCVAFSELHMLPFLSNTSHVFDVGDSALCFIFHSEIRVAEDECRKKLRVLTACSMLNSCGWPPQKRCDCDCFIDRRKMKRGRGMNMTYHTFAVK